MYAKLINGNLQPAPNPIFIDPWWIGNPTPELLIAEGYKPVIYTDPPEVEPGFVAVSGWEENVFEIVQTWTVEAEPVTEDEALTRFVNELTGQQDETLTEATESLIKKYMEV